MFPKITDSDIESVRKHMEKPKEQLYDVLYCSKSFKTGCQVWHTQVEAIDRENAIGQANAMVNKDVYYLISVTLHELDLDE